MPRATHTRTHPKPPRAHSLLYLAQLFDLETACLTARAVVLEGREPSEGVVMMLNEIAGSGR